MDKKKELPFDPVPLQADSRRLREAFYHSYDASQVTEIKDLMMSLKGRVRTLQEALGQLAHYIEGRQRHLSAVPLIGTGADRVVLKLTAAPQMAAQYGLDLALSLPNIWDPRTPTQEKSHHNRRKEWSQAIEILRQATASGDLKGHGIPPFEVLSSGERGTEALVMPYGPQGLEARATHWPAPTTLQERLCSFLASLGLVLDDQLQYRVWRGVPFVVDLSDLVRQHSL